MKIKTICMAAITALLDMGARVRAEIVTVESLQQKLIDLNQAANDIQNACDAEDRQLAPEETEKIDSILFDYKETEKDIVRREAILANSAALTESVGRRSAPNDVVAKDDNSDPHAAPRKLWREPLNHAEVGKCGFKTFGAFASSVMAGSNPTAPKIDPRLIVDAPTTYGNEGVGADGGFAVPSDFRNEIMQLVEAEDELMGMTEQLNTSGNSMTLPKDETSPWQTSGGIQSYWEGEAAQMTQSKPALGENLLKLKKLTTLVPITEEMAEDSSTIDSWLRAKVPAKMAFKINDAIINGTGAGMPMGIMNSGAMIAVAKESGQTADTVVFENIVNMWARMYAPSRRNAIWLINQDIEPQLDTMAFPTAATAVPMYMPPGGLADTPYGRMKGRPVMATQAAQTLGDAGDVMLVDLKQYMTIKKAMGIKSDVSMHLWFDYATLAYRFIIRLDGQPNLSAPIDPLHGTNTLSPFVTLAERA
ncbi:MAG: phage major capsid protein [Gammaproteobacteria bacterium]